MAAYQVPSSYDPNAATYLPGTQDDEENAGAPKMGVVSAPKPYMPPTSTDYSPAPSMSTGTQKASDAPAQPQTFSQMQDAGIARPPQPDNSNGLPAAAQVQSNYDPNASTYLPGTQDNSVFQAPSMYQATNNTPTNTVVPQLSLNGQQANPPAYDAGGAVAPNATNTLGYGDANPQASADPSAGMTTAQWDAYSPGANLSEAQKAALMMKNVASAGLAPVDPSMFAIANTQTGTTGNPNAGGSVATYTPNAGAIANLNNLAATDPAVAAAQAGQASTLANYNATNTAANDASNLASQNALNAALYNQPGYAAQYGAPPPAATTYTPPVNSPNVTQGFPAAYDPTKAVQPNNGSVDANGNYVLPGTTPTYLPPGGVSSSTGFVPSDNPGTPGTSGTPTTQLPPQNSTQTPTNGTTGTPGTTPTGGAYDVLNAITQGAQGQGGGSAVQNATQQAALNLLNNPSPYNSQAVQDFYNTQAQNIDDQTTLQKKALAEQMAKRGLGASDIYGGNLEDLNIGQRTAKEALSEDLAHQYATSLGNYQTGAVNTGNTVGNTAQQAQQSWIQQLMGYGQNAFNNDLETNQQNQNASNNWQNYILQMLGMGYSPTG